MMPKTFRTEKQLSDLLHPQTGKWAAKVDGNALFEKWKETFSSVEVNFLIAAKIVMMLT